MDAGISLRQIMLRLRRIDVELSDIDAVVVTHEHSDHTAALPRIDAPVFVASATLNLWKDKVGSLMEFESDSPFDIRDLRITPFSVPHDALDPVGFTIESQKNEKVGVVTDIGCPTQLVKERLKEADVLVIEYNHDNDILLYSHYPWDLKQRIKGRLGHLSNLQASELLGELIHSRLRHIVLAHLSQVNNRPEVAFASAETVVKRRGAEEDLHVSIAPRKSVGEVLRI